MSYSVSVAVAKTVLADRLLRLMDPDRRSRRSVIKQVFVSLTVLQVAEEIFVQLFACQPTRGSVLLHLGGTCLQQRPMWLTGVSTCMTCTDGSRCYRQVEEILGTLGCGQSAER